MNDELVPLYVGSKHTPVSARTHPIGAGVQLLFRFPNGYGASLVDSPGSYGYEMAVIEWEIPSKGEDPLDTYHLNYETPITGDVLGHLTPEEIESYLDQIKALPPVQTELPSAPRKELSESED